MIAAHRRWKVITGDHGGESRPDSVRGRKEGRGQICHVGPVGQREQWESDRGRCGARLSARAGAVPDGRARLVSEVKRALRVVRGRPRGLGRAGHWAERERKKGKWAGWVWDFWAGFWFFSFLFSFLIQTLLQSNTI